MPEDKTFSLRVDLKDKTASIFLKIIEERNFQSKAEAVRYCIMEAYNKEDFQLEEGYREKIRMYLGYEFVKHQERVFTTQDFVSRALDLYMDKIQTETQSILSFDVRKELKQEDLAVAMEFIKCQDADPAQQVTVDQLAKKMNRRNTKALETTLESFVDRGILDKITHDTTVYYHAKKISEF